MIRYLFRKSFISTRNKFHKVDSASLPRNKSKDIVSFLIQNNDFHAEYLSRTQTQLLVQQAFKNKKNSKQSSLALLLFLVGGALLLNGDNSGDENWEKVELGLELILKGFITEDENDYKQGIELLYSAGEIYPEILAGIKLNEQGKLEEFFNLWDSFFLKQENKFKQASLSYLTLKAIVLLNTPTDDQHIAEGIALLQNLTSKFNMYPWSHLVIGKYYLEQGKKENNNHQLNLAILAFRNAEGKIQEASILNYLYRSEGIVLVRLENYVDSIKALDLALEFNAKDYLSYMAKGIALAKLNQSEESLKCFNKSIAYVPTFNALYNKGTLLFELKRYQEAVDTFKESTRFQNNEPSAYHNIGLAYSRLGQYELAIIAFDQAIEFESEPNLRAATLHSLPQDKYNLNLVFVSNNDPSRILGTGLLVVPEIKITTEGRKLEKSSFSNEGSFNLLQKSDDKQNQIKKNKGNLPTYHNAKGLVLIKLGRYEEAKSALLLAIEANPECGEALHNLGVLMYHQGDYGAAISHYKEVIQVAKKNNLAFNIAFTYHNIGAVLQAQGNLTDSIEFFLLAINLDKSMPQNYLRLGLVLSQLGYEQNAIAVLKHGASVATLDNLSKEILLLNLYILSNDLSFSTYLHNSNLQNLKGDLSQELRHALEKKISESQQNILEQLNEAYLKESKFYQDHHIHKLIENKTNKNPDNVGQLGSIEAFMFLASLNLNLGVNFFIGYFGSFGLIGAGVVGGTVILKTYQQWMHHLLNQKNHEGKTPLMLAMETGDPNLVTALLSKGASVDECYINLNDPNQNYFQDMVTLSLKTRFFSALYTIPSQYTALSLEKLINSCAAFAKDNGKTTQEGLIRHDELNKYIDLKTSELLGFNIKDFITNADILKYQHHLDNKAGVITDINFSNEQSNIAWTEFNRALGRKLERESYVYLEGWTAIKFLTLRVRGYLLQLTLNKVPCQLQDKMKQECEIAVNTIKIMKRIELLNQSDLSSDQKQKLLKEYVLNLSAQVIQMKEGECFVIKTGYSGHAIYANYFKDNGKIAVRIDNLGDGSSSRHLPINLEHKYPCLIDIMNSNVDIAGYMMQIFNATNLEPHKREEAFQKIYKNKCLDHREQFSHWKSQAPQKVQNCVVTNYDVGSQIRLGENTFSLFRRKEKDSIEILKDHFENKPIIDDDAVCFAENSFQNNSWQF